MRGDRDPAALFEAWFSDCSGLIYLAAICPEGGLAAQARFPVGHWSRLLVWAREQSDAGRNVYFCPVTQRSGVTAPRSEATAYEVPGLFADVDLLSGRATDAAHVWSLLCDTGHVTAAVASGWGFHCYGKLSEPLRVGSVHRADVKELLHAYGARLNLTAHGRVGRVDRYDLASLLRVPGTINYPNQKKRTKGRGPVDTVVHFQSEIRLTLDRVTAELRPYARGTRPEDSASTGGAAIGDLPPDWETWLAADNTLRGYFERSLPPRGDDQSPSAYAMALANRLAKTHPEVTDEEALAVLHCFYSRCGDTKSPQALQKTWAKARRSEGEGMGWSSAPDSDQSVGGGSAWSFSPSNGWPDAPAPGAFHGLPGDVVRLIEPHSEADPVALLAQTLLAFGNVVGRGPHYPVEGDRHCMNLFVTLVGETAKARKGSSWGQVSRLFAMVDPLWTSERVQHGLSSGEGLIWAVRDKKPNEEDDGVDDKRLLVVEGEFGGTLRVMERQGNTLSSVMRQAWDAGDLRSLTKNTSARATNAHVSILGHVTKDELRRYLTCTEAGNGFANRFLWLAVRRSKCLPEGGDLNPDVLEGLAARLRAAVAVARSTGVVRFDDEARRAWHDIYPALSEGKPGLLGATIARAEAQVVRLASLYALLDHSPPIKAPHLRAALAVWRYAEASARWVFGDVLGNPIAEKILRALRGAQDGLTRTQIRDLFSRNKNEAEIAYALDLLRREGLACSKMEATGGRDAERWYAVDTTKTTDDDRRGSR